MNGFDHEATSRLPIGQIECRWAVGTCSLQFGKDSDVPCPERLVKGVLAELEVRRSARRATVRVSGAKVAQQELQHGDEVQVGKARFTCEIEA
jgi:hypothetical protein